ncbi:MAG TPA: UDP-N-acetylmuramoyl-L-alanine--D-glutamate ligase [Candidatus Paceibacterota bacterium]
MNYKEYFAGKKVTVMGLGLLGRGIGDAAFIADAGAAEVIVTDRKAAAELAESVEKLQHLPNVQFVLGEHRLQDFEDRDLVLVAAGVPLDSEFVVHAKEHSRNVAQSAALFAVLAEVPIIGVTGTRGKSTVTHMIHHVLSVTTDGPVLLGGNVRGVSNLQLLNEVTEESLVVMELDSWQLQGFGWAKRSPQIAVFTNFMSDHMNYYKGDMDAYFADKANIFKYQDDHDVFITIPEVFERAKRLSGVTLGQEVVLVDESVIPEDAKLSMPGEHNRLNAALAFEALKATSLTEEEIFAGLASFPGVPGRLEYLGEINDVKIYNDNNSTVPQATVMGLKAVGNINDKNVILIAGGAYKEVDPDVLIETIPLYCKKVVLLPGTGTDRMTGKVEAAIVGDLKEAVREALKAAEPGDVLLFSPAFASFGLYKNEYERNDDFVRIINSLSQE